MKQDVLAKMMYLFLTAFLWERSLAKADFFFIVWFFFLHKLCNREPLLNSFSVPESSDLPFYVVCFSCCYLAIYEGSKEGFSYRVFAVTGSCYSQFWSYEITIVYHPSTRHGFQYSGNRWLQRIILSWLSAAKLPQNKYSSSESCL